MFYTQFILILTGGDILCPGLDGKTLETRVESKKENKWGQRKNTKNHIQRIKPRSGAQNVFKWVR